MWKREARGVRRWVASLCSQIPKFEIRDPNLTFLVLHFPKKFPKTPKTVLCLTNDFVG
jgi:hypothetical protein